MTRELYRLFRRMKTHCIEHPRSVEAGLFFRLLPLIDRVGRSRTTARAPLQLPDPELTVKALRDAAAGADSAFPHGTATDNSVNPRFNEKLRLRFPAKRALAVMDLGCAGGGFVRTLLEDGHTAIGLEGSPFPRDHGLGEWRAVPRHLFTCDIAEPFSVLRADGATMRFDCITAWEVLEHIPREKLPTFFANVAKHLAPGGIFVASVALFRDENPLTGAVYHVTLEPREWWTSKAADAGLGEVAAHPFATKDFVRGNGTGLVDWDPADGDGFHLVLEHRPS